MGGSRHLKRFAAPGFWPIPKKERRWVVKPSPGPHPIEACIPLLLVVRDVLKLATTAREVKRIIKSGKVLIDGRPVFDHKFPVGLMDTVCMPDADIHLRATSDASKFIKFIEIPEEETNLKVVRIKRKQTVRGGRIQLTGHDGRNFLADGQLSGVKVGDSLLIRVPSQEVLEVLPFEVGCTALVVKGRKAGRIGKVREIGEYVRIVDADNPSLSYLTLKESIIVVGREAPSIRVR